MRGRNNQGRRSDTEYSATIGEPKSKSSRLSFESSGIGPPKESTAKIAKGAKMIRNGRTNGKQKRRGMAARRRFVRSRYAIRGAGLRASQSMGGHVGPPLRAIRRRPHPTLSRVGRGEQQRKSSGCWPVPWRRGSFGRWLAGSRRVCGVLRPAARANSSRAAVRTTGGGAGCGGGKAQVRYAAADVAEVISGSGTRACFFLCRLFHGPDLPERSGWRGPHISASSPGPNSVVSAHTTVRCAASAAHVRSRACSASSGGSMS